MKCEDVSKGLIAYLDGRVADAERSRVEKHLAGCATCRTRAEEFRKVWTMLDEVPAVEPSFGFDARVRQRVAAEPRLRWYGWFVPAPRIAFAAALLIALMVWVARIPLTNPGAPPTVAAIQQEDFNAIKDLGVLENYDVVTKMDALSELAPVTTSQPDKPQQGEQVNSND
ncbi:MAG: zf-HC2 domain-containing protein [Candidatus Acidiferrales bacterium]|jgi:anti-sigma factor RsiW